MELAISTTDTVIMVVYVAAVVVFGLWIGRGPTDLSGYLLGGRNMPWWAILGSIVATETSTATFLSVPGIAFAEDGDFRFLQLAIGFTLGRVIVARVLLPLYFRGQLFTAYEVLKQRFGGITSRVASVMFLVARNLGDGLRLFLAGIVLEKIVGVELEYCIIAIGLATIVYTFFGGMKAVIWSDCIQMVVYVTGGCLALMILIQSLPGGWSELSEFARERDKFRVFDFRLGSLPDPFSLFTDPLNSSAAIQFLIQSAIFIFFLLTEPLTFWAGLFGGAALSLGTHGTDQMMVQRYLCAPSQRSAGVALVLSGVVVFAQFALFLLLGVALACFYATVSPRAFEHPDEVFASFIVEQLPVGLVGVTLAAVFSAAMSTLSSSLNSSATAAMNDLYRGGRHEGDDQSSGGGLLRASRAFTVAFGLVQIAVGIGASHLSSSVVSDALAIAGFTAGILLGIFALGVLTRRTKQTGALAGLIAGIAVLTLVKFLTPVAWTWYAVIGAVTTFTVGYLSSGMGAAGPDPDAPSQTSPMEN